MAADAPTRPRTARASSRATIAADAQRRADGRRAARRVGFEPDALAPGRLACTRSRRSMAHTDVRLTTRWEEDDLAMALYSCPARVRPRALRGADGPAPLPHDARRGDRRSASTSRRAGCGRTSSAARGRSASGCCRCCARTSAGRSRRSTPTSSTAASTASELSLIRIEADETTYNLHIVLRFELELALIEGRLAVDDLPEAWNEATHRLLGLEVPDAAPGRPAGHPLGRRADRLLPDLHARQPDGRAAVERADAPTLPDIEAEHRGRASSPPLREWLRENIHRHGRKFDAARAAAARDRGGAPGGAVPRLPAGEARSIPGDFAGRTSSSTFRPPPP